MAHPISPLGVVHTLVSLVPIVAGIYSFVRYRKIDTSQTPVRFTGSAWYWPC